MGSAFTAEELTQSD